VTLRLPMALDEHTNGAASRKKASQAAELRANEYASPLTARAEGMGGRHHEVKHEQRPIQPRVLVEAAVPPMFYFRKKTTFLIEIIFWRCKRGGGDTEQALVCGPQRPRIACCDGRMCACV
jgi:hypothetical protein